jgi:hypothetical protein
MPKRYKRKKQRNFKRLFTIVAIPILVLILSLAWIWKSNQVKENYANMKKLEVQKSNLIAENMRLKASLMDLKSISQIDKIVTVVYGLTQNVSGRLILSDPVTRAKKIDKLNFAGDGEMPDWLENAVVGSGRVRAEEPKDSGD